MRRANKITKSRQHSLLKTIQLGIVMLLMVGELFSIGIACQKRIAGLENQLVNATGIGRVNVLNNLVTEYLDFNINPQKSLDYGKESLDLSQKLNYKKGEAKALINIGFGLHLQSKFEQALKYYFQALKIREEIGDKKDIAESAERIGNCFWTLRKYNLALSYFNKYLKISEEIGWIEGNMYSLQEIGNTYHAMTKYDQALAYYNKSLQFAEKKRDQWQISSLYNDIGGIYQASGKYDQALEYLNKSYKIMVKEANTSGLAVPLKNLGFCYLKLHRLVEAEKCFKQSLSIAKETKESRLFIENYKYLSQLFKIRGDIPQAFSYYRLFHEEYENVFNEKNNLQINELQAKYQAEKREKEITLLKKNEEIQGLKLSKVRLLRNALIIGLFLLVIILGLLFRKYLYFFAFWKKQTFIGQYRLLEKIGSGGMGTVYKAHHTKDKTQLVAIKILHEDLMTDESYRQRFIHESTIIDQLKHPNIIKIIERGEDKQQSFLVMEYLQGITLAQKMSEKNKLSLSDILHIMLQISDALVQIHEKGIVHRDLKPENIMLLTNNDDPYFVKLLDFGIARAAKQTKLTQTGKIIGTVRYMSPEQRRGEHQISTPSDIYSLGIIFYEMVTGVNAFSQDSEIASHEALYKKLAEPISLKPNLPVTLNDLITRMINKEAMKRPDTKIVLNKLSEIKFIATGKK